ncbi:MAG: hypothetical protein AABY18_10575, partial [Candidatus Thermoplasmatota archaeon]
AKLRVGKDTLVFYNVQSASAATGGVSTSSVDAAPETQAIEPAAVKASSKGAPGVPFLALLGLVGAVAWMRRRAD